jgi:hypothetical protein
MKEELEPFPSLRKRDSPIHPRIHFKGIYRAAVE